MKRHRIRLNLVFSATSAGYLAALTTVLLLCSPVAAASQSQPSPAAAASQSQPSPAAAASQSQPSPAAVSMGQALSRSELAQLRRDIRQIARVEADARLAASEHLSGDIAERAMKDADRTMTFVSWLTAAFVAILGALAAVLFFGERNLIKKLRDEAVDLVRSSQEAIKRVNEFDSAILKALEEIDGYGKTLPDAQVPRAMGTPFEFTKPELNMQIEEADILAVIGQRIRPQKDPKELAQAFRRLGGYWLNVDNFPRAIARYERAAKLDPESWEVYTGLAQTISELAALPGTPLAAKFRHLEKSDEYCRIAETLAGRQLPDTRHRFGWNADERGRTRPAVEYYDSALDYYRAVEFYKQAQQLDPRKPKPLYDLACVFSDRLGNYPAAFAELTKLVDVVQIPDVAQRLLNLNQLRDLATTDSDLRGLLNDPGYGPRLKQLLGI